MAPDHPLHVNYTANMASYDEIEVVHALRTEEVNKMTNPQLKKALFTLHSVENAGQVSNNTLLEEIHGLRKQVEELGVVKQELQNVKQEVEHLSSRLMTDQKPLN